MTVASMSRSSAGFAAGAVFSTGDRKARVFALPSQAFALSGQPLPSPLLFPVMAVPPLALCLCQIPYRSCRVLTGHR